MECALNITPVEERLEYAEIFFDSGFAVKRERNRTVRNRHVDQLIWLINLHINFYEAVSCGRARLDTLFFALFSSVKFAGFGLLNIYIKDPRI